MRWCVRRDVMLAQGAVWFICIHRIRPTSPRCLTLAVSATEVSDVQVSLLPQPYKAWKDVKTYEEGEDIFTIEY